MPLHLDSAKRFCGRLLWLVFMLFCQQQALLGQAKPTINEGKLDLRSLDIADTAFYLEGQVQFYWQSFLEEAPDSDAAHTYINFPGL